MVTFELHNLQDSMAARRHGIWDVIFCRNVMIYFDDAMKKQVVQTFHNQLAPAGTLVIGHSENLRNIDVPFSPIDVAEAFAYVKSDSLKKGA
jgi:chemotaxis protein methyltransferase CheR